MSKPIKAMIAPTRARMAGYLKEVEEILAAETGEVGRGAAQKRKLQQLQLRIKNGVDLLERENQKWSELIHRTAANERQALMDDFDDWVKKTCKFIETTTEARECLDLLEFELMPPATPTPTSPVPPTPGAEGSVDNNAAARALLGNGGPASSPSSQLPKIQLPQFHGDPLEWATFWQTFEALVDSQRVHSIQKLQYLFGCLRGDAAKEVSGFQLRAENYPIVVELLKKRYDNKQLNISALHRQLINLPVACDSTESIKDLAKAVERICRQLNSLDEEGNDQQIITQVKAKLPKAFLLELVKLEYSAGRDKKWTAAELRENIQIILDIREEVERNYSHHKSKENGEDKSEKTGKKNKFQQRIEKSRAFPAVDKNSESRPDTKGAGGKKKLPCALCDMTNHWARWCRKFDTAEKAKNQLSKLGKCHKCYREGHKSTDCPKSEWKCRLCESPSHGSIVCPKRPSTTPPSGEKREEKGAKYTAAPVVAAAVSAKEKLEGDEDEVLLMTKHLEVSSEFNAVQSRALTFFDTGSQKSWITMGLAKRLKLPRLTKPQLVEISGWESKCSKFHSPKFLVKVKLEEGGFHELVVNGTPSITDALKETAAGEVQNLAEAEERVAQILQASEEPPEVLIGMSEFWDFITTVEKVKPGLYLIGTTVGKMFCGRNGVGEIEKFKQVGCPVKSHRR